MPWKQGSEGDQWEKEQDKAFRAIGWYVVTFSTLVREMREIACEYVAKGVTDMHVSSLPLGEATAAPIASAYFGLCWRMGELDEDEQRVWSVLRNEVTEAIQTRNDIAHGDWEVGSLAMGEAEGELKVMPPRLIQIIPTRREGAYQYTDLTVEDIHALSDRIEDLLGLIQDFGKLALKLPVVAHDEGSHVSMGKYRVSDVLVVRGRVKNPGKPRASRRSKAKIERTGPHAAEVFGGIYASLGAREARSDQSAEP